MLRITLAKDDGRTCLRLEGQLAGAWVAECRDAATRDRDRNRPAALDLTAVTFVDANGVALLRSLISAGHPILNCSAFVAELLRLEGLR